MGWPLLLLVLLALVLGACGAGAPLPPSCLEARDDDVLRALRHAPRDVALHDGTSLSTCVERAIGDVDLQVLGVTLTTAADRLARRAVASDRIAFQLGFLMGAVERGAARTSGAQSELSARVGQAAGFDGGPPQRRDALLRGRAAGRRSG